MELVTSNRILYTATPFAKSSLLYVQEIGSLEAAKPHRSMRVDLESYLFFCVRSGAGQLTYCGKTYELHAGDMIFIDCRLPYSHETDPKELWELSWIHFNGGALPSIYEKYVSRGGRPVFHPADEKKYQSLHDELFAIAASDDYIRDMKLNAGLSQLLVYIMEESWNPDETVGEQKKHNLLPIKEYLDEHYAQKISLDELAERFGISKFYLTRVFKEQYGVSVNNYLLQTRITKAKNMLRFTDEKIETIGHACGLGEANYFSRMFRQAEGISPSEYRQKW